MKAGDTVFLKEKKI